VCGRPKHTLKHLQDSAAVAASKAAVAGEKGASGTGALRTALPGRDASGDHSLFVSPLASAGPPTDAARGRRQSARHGVRAASRSWGAGGSSSCAPHQTQRGSCAIWTCWLDLLEAHQQTVQREIYLVLDNGSAQTSKGSEQALAARQDWLHVIWLAQ